MRKLILIAFMLLSYNVNAETSQQMLNSNVSIKPSALSLDNPSGYEAKNVSGYEGRNKNANQENLTSQVSNGRSLSKTIQSKTSSKSTQLENLESTAGELVQKLEDDRVKRIRKHKDTYDSSKEILNNAYQAVLDVDVNKLGSEQDPEIQNAFKCLDIKACNKNPEIANGVKDSRAIKRACARDERLHWNGSSWKCVGIFSELSPVSCSSDQYQKSVNGGLACIDYLYSWGSNSYTSCDASGNKISITNCFRKKKQSDANVTVVADSKCLGKKPAGIKEQCTTSWQTTGWSGCSKTCGGGTQTRSVTCPTGYKCIGSRPYTTKSCNTQACTCSNPTGSVGEVRSVTTTHRRGGRNDNTWTETTCYQCSSSLTWQEVSCSGSSWERKDDTRRNERNGW